MVDDLTQQVCMTRTGIWYVCRRYETVGLETIYDAPRSGHPREISALERVAIEQLARCDAAALGLKITHWSTRSLEADLQPHRYRYWRTPTLNAEFQERASRVLWCYERVDRLMEHEKWCSCWIKNPISKPWNAQRRNS